METCKRIADHQHSRPQTPARRRQDHVQRVVLRRQQGWQVCRRIDLSRWQDGGARWRESSARAVRPAVREMNIARTDTTKIRPRSSRRDLTPGTARTRCRFVPSLQEPAKRRSILVGGDNLTAVERNQTTKRDDVDRVFQEADAAITHQDVAAARVERGELVVIAGVVALGNERASLSARPWPRGPDDTCCSAGRKRRSTRRALPTASNGDKALHRRRDPDQGG